MNQPDEPHIIINGVTLNSAQVMTLRSAINHFSLDLRSGELGEAEIGKELNVAYLTRLHELEELFFSHKNKR